MARFSLWVAALSLVCLVAVVTSQTAPPTTTSTNVCSQFFNDGSTMTISRAFDMIEINYKQYVPNFGTEQMRSFMAVADGNQDNRLDKTECGNLIGYIKNLKQ